MIRRTLLAAASGLLALCGLASCSTGPAGGTADTGSAGATSQVDKGAFPVTIKHAFGSTTIAKEPKRIAVVGVNDQDMLLALGVVPVSIAKVTWGGDADGTTPWFDAKLKELRGKKPAILDQTDSIPVDEVAEQRPDLILATYSGLTRADYDRLSKIAPVVAYPSMAWGTPWQKSLEMVGQATGRNRLAAKVEASTEKEIADAKRANPSIQGKTFVFASLATTDLSQIPYYTPQDARPTFLTELGMVNAPYVVAHSPTGEFYTQVSAEKAADLRSDFFFTYAVKASDAQTFAKDKQLGQIPAIKSGHMWASTDNVASLAAGIPTPLSVPYAIDHFLPGVVKAVAGKQ
ncbi:MAG: iron-siderophore ABC transporter substrate-binding protein [Nocardioides sp.]|nr:iron-siderophore ABC transporter substrate-binding protein [Nocardioides sp.]